MTDCSLVLEATGLLLSQTLPELATVSRMAGDDNDDDKMDLSVSRMAGDDNDDDKIYLSGDRVDDVSSRSSCCSTPGACFYFLLISFDCSPKILASIYIHMEKS